MKKIMMIAAMMVATLSASAQNEVGQITLKPTVGVNFASMTKIDNSSSRTGILAGVEAEYGVAEKFGVTAGVFYSMQGAKHDALYKATEGGVTVTAGDKATFKLDYINIPILAQYYVIPGLAIKAGIQPGFCVSKKYDYEASMSIDGVAGGDKTSGKFTTDDINTFQFAIPVGISYEYQSFVLDARYNIGLTKAFKSSWDTSSRHNVFSISLGYKFAL